MTYLKKLERRRISQQKLDFAKQKPCTENNRCKAFLSYLTESFKALPGVNLILVPALI